MSLIKSFGHSGKSKKKEEMKKLEDRRIQQEKMFKQVEDKLKREVEELKRAEEARAQKEEEDRMGKEAARLAQDDERLKEEKIWREENERRRGAIMDVAESSAQVVDFSQGTMGLVDRLEAHPAGKMLKNTVISNEPPPDRELNIMRLRTFKPQNDFAKMTLHDVPPVELMSEFAEFPITQAMTDTQFNELKDYILVSDVFFHFIPMDSFYSKSSPVTFQINDFRKIDNTCMRRYPLSNTGGYNILMSLDYCVAKKDLHHLSYSVSTTLNTFRKGASWGAVKVVLTVSHMDFPVKSNIQETMGVLHLADSDLKEYISDPRHSDGYITPQALNLLRSHYKRGEIENINKPRDDKVEINTAQTVVGGGEQSTDVRDLMFNMRNAALEQERQRNAHSMPVKSALRSSGHRRVNTVDDDDSMNGANNLADVPVGYDPTDNESEETVEMPRRQDSPPRGVRGVSFG